MSDAPKGTLIIIGGHEERDVKNQPEILEQVAATARKDGNSLLVVSVASELPEEEWQLYVDAFHELGVKKVSLTGLKSREDGCDPETVQKVAEASTVFFTGGDQLRITSQVGDTNFYSCLQEIYWRGATIAGTSAGAAAMPETMIVAGSSKESFEVSALNMAPGLGLAKGVVIDSHFAERGRMGRLLGAVVQNPKNIGLGIDENTAVIMHPDRMLSVIGTGAVYVLDGAGITYSSIAEDRTGGPISIHGARLHVLTEGDGFNLAERQPMHGGPVRTPSASYSSAKR